MTGRHHIGTTSSLCPVCLRRIAAEITADDTGVYMEKGCVAHGPFSVLIWKGDPRSYVDWTCDSVSEPIVSETCSAALMVTSRCNLDCPVCFTRSPAQEATDDPGIPELARRLRLYLRSSGSPFPLELCGGEPTIRDDLAEIASMAVGLGYADIQLNTNGIRLGTTTDLAEQLKAAGVSIVYMSFDGLTELPHRLLRGADLRDVKLRALERCASAGLAVVLVPVLLWDANMDQLGQIIKLATEWVPHVKGVHFQPMSRFGTYPPRMFDRATITIPEILELLEHQTEGAVKRTHFIPGRIEHPLCSFRAVYMVDRDGKLMPVTRRGSYANIENGTARSRGQASAQWRPSPARTLTVGGMLFQDVWNLDLKRLGRCPIHVICERELVPLCAKYVTAVGGDRLHPGIA